MSENSKISNIPARFIKLIMSEETDFLQENYPNAFLLLIQIAKSARRTPNGLDGLKVGDAIVGEIETSRKSGLSIKEYRNALEKLEEFRFIETVFNPKSKKPQKRAIKRAIKSKIVNLINSTICDINANHEGEQLGDLGANKGRSEGDKQERIRKNKNEKEDHHPNPSSKVLPIRHDELMMTDDFSSNDIEIFMQHNVHSQTTSPPKPTHEIVPGVFLSQEELDACIKIKGSFESVQHAIGYIMRSPGRKETIKDWPNALARWQIKNDIKPKLKEHEEMAMRLEQDHANSPFWKCEVYTDRKKDQKGILFFNTAPAGNSEPIFIPFMDGEFKKKVSKVLRDKKMQKGRV